MSSETSDRDLGECPSGNDALGVASKNAITTKLVTTENAIEITVSPRPKETNEKMVVLNYKAKGFLCCRASRFVSSLSFHFLFFSFLPYPPEFLKVKKADRKRIGIQVWKGGDVLLSLY
jgi:hypothetical protein